MDNSLDKVIDARLYVYTVQLLSSSTDIDKLLAYLRVLNAKVLSSQKSFHFTTRRNILHAILVYTYPLNVKLEDITKLAKQVIEPSKVSTDAESFDVEEFAFGLPSLVMNDTSLLATAQDVLVDTDFQCLYLMKFDSSPESLLLSFIQAKTLQLSKYFNNVNDIVPLYDDVSSDEFQSWFSCVILPFKYYYEHYGQVYKGTSLEEYLVAGDTIESKLSILIAPLATRRVANLDHWITNVIIPVIRYYGNDFRPLNEWLFYSEAGPTGEEGSAAVNKYRVWNSCISSINQHFRLAEFKEVIETYLAVCYYFSFSDDSDTISSVDIMNSYDLMHKTLSLFKTSSSIHSAADIDFSKVPTNCTTLREFNTQANPISSLFHIEAILLLNQAIETCQKLFPINKLTIRKYFQFKYDPESMDTEREILRLTSNINHSNWQQLIKSVNLFKSSFATGDEVSSIIVERLLFANLFDVVDELFFNDKLEGISTNQFYLLLEEKLWDSLNHATNLNEKSGLLYNAQQCLNLFDKLVLKKDLDQSHHNQVVKFKHLFKAMHALKNFKIVVDRHKPLTPYVLIHDFADNNVLSLVTIVLEQNPKSYLAFEKLYRILNDLLIFFDEDDDGGKNKNNYYFNKLKTACIESALIDNNFNYAYTQSIELFKYFESKANDRHIDEFWLTFYQVGKYISPQWFENPEGAADLEVLIKQREILSLTISTLNLGENSKIVINQWQALNEKIQRNSLENDINKVKQQLNNENSRANYSAKHLENIGSIANDIINDASKTTNNASEKISNLFVSGLGWAIGANQRK
ncbi:Protein transport protein SEC39 [Candida viswanathii]|uniref:Protein transport protein SEC39 n=1 Tax=Candida viswanathii TaxID=5486 RepID=A0A367YBI1_9ASCO|nr:Protein transport protein SEC39 [Candida viswanathii]